LQLLLHKQSDGHSDLSKVDTERLIAHFVEEELNKRAAKGQYKGKFAAITSIRSNQVSICICVIVVAGSVWSCDVFSFV
jgi:hypothetical protein